MARPPANGDRSPMEMTTDSSKRLPEQVEIARRRRVSFNSCYGRGLPRAWPDRIGDEDRQQLGSAGRRLDPNGGGSREREGHEVLLADQTLRWQRARQEVRGH